jgi:hypothetical protein
MAKAKSSAAAKTSKAKSPSAKAAKSAKSATPAKAASSKSATTAKAAASSRSAPSKSATSAMAATVVASSSTFAPPTWGHRPPVPLVPVKTGDAALDVAMAAFAAAPEKFALYKKVFKHLTADNALVLLAGSALDLGTVYYPTAAELDALDRGARRNWHKVLLDVCDQTPRGQMVARLTSLLGETPEGRTRLLELATATDTSERGRCECAATLCMRPEATRDDLAQLARAFATVAPEVSDGVYAMAIELALLFDPAATIATILPLLRSDHPFAGALLDAIESAASESRHGDARKALHAKRDREALATLVAPVTALLGDATLNRKGRVQRVLDALQV